MGAPDRLGADFRQPDMPDVTGADHVGDGADRVLDWHCRIEPGRAIDVDIVGAEPAQRVGEKVLHRRRPAVVADEHAGRIAQRAEFHRNDHAVARHAFERAADQHLVVAHAVEVAGVEKIDAGIERGADRGDAFGFVRRSVDARRHAHTAEAERAYLRSAPAQFHCLHHVSLAIMLPRGNGVYR